jgi:hypothetical protein
MRHSSPERFVEEVENSVGSGQDIPIIKQDTAADEVVLLVKDDSLPRVFSVISLQQQKVTIQYSSKLGVLEKIYQTRFLLFSFSFLSFIYFFRGELSHPSIVRFVPVFFYHPCPLLYLNCSRITESVEDFV